MYNSETDKVRQYLEKYCIGYGLDIGCGVNKIVPNALGIDFSKQYNIPDHPDTAANFRDGWEAFFEIFNDKQWDYIYSSHLIEDYLHLWEILQVWSAFIKTGGLLILVLPIEEVYRKLGNNLNPRHVHNWAGSLDFLSQMPNELLNKFVIIGTSSEIEPIVDYSFYVVLQKK